MQVQRTIKRREGVWGIDMGDKGGASQVAPLSPLTKEKRNESLENLLLSLRGEAEAINEQRILMILVLHTFDCHAF